MSSSVQCSRIAAVVNSSFQLCLSLNLINGEYLLKKLVKKAICLPRVKLLHHEAEPLNEDGVMAAQFNHGLADPDLGMEAVEADEGGVGPGGEDVGDDEDVSVEIQASELPQPRKPAM